jgi:hypothetical protein
MTCLFARASAHPPHHIALALQRNETLEWADPSTAVHSLELFDRFYNPKKARLRRAVYMLVNAADHLAQNEYAQAFILGWAVIEHCISRRWDRTLEDLAAGSLPTAAIDFICAEEQRQGRKPSEFPVSSRIAALKLVYPDASCYVRADALRLLRNEFVHDLERISPDDGSRAAQVALELMQANYGMNLRLNTGYGYAL